MRLPRTGRSPAIDENIIFGNTAVGGGGVRLCFFTGVIDEPTFQGNTIFDNEAYQDGGGVQVYEADPVIAGCTIDGNQAGWMGGGIYAGRRTVGPILTTTITNTIVTNTQSGWGVASDLSPVVTSLCDVWNNAGGDYLNCSAAPNDMSEDPLYCDVPNDDFTLRDDSPCLPENNSWGALIGAHGAGGCGTGITGDPASQAVFRLDPPFPNPSGGRVTLGYSVRQTDVPVVIEIFSVTGRLVRRLEATPGSPCTGQLLWDGRDREGRPVASGAYLLKGRAGARTDLECAVILRGR